MLSPNPPKIARQRAIRVAPNFNIHAVFAGRPNASSADTNARAVVASRGDWPMGDHSAGRARAACSVNPFGADDGIRFNGNRRKEKRSQRSE
jgi:hypothetical protein